jgi:hypothetical protein
MNTLKLQAKFVGLSILATVGLLVLPMLASASGTVVISGDTSTGENMPGWLFNRDQSTATPYEFNTDQSSIGLGSLYVLPIGPNPADKFIGEFFPGTLAVADLNSFSYDFLIGANGNSSDENEFYLSVYTNFGETDDNNFYDCRYNVVPTVGSTADWTTVTFDPTQAYSVTTRGSSPHTCPAVPADMDLLSPGSNVRVFALNMGDTSANDVGLDGYYDNVVVDVVGDVTVYDFEPTPMTKDDCKDNGHEDFGFANQGQCIRFVETGKDSR